MRRTRPLAANTLPRRFPPPWTVEEQKMWFVVRDREGQQLDYSSRVLPAVVIEKIGAGLTQKHR
jgi:hypothetical protein